MATTEIYLPEQSELGKKSKYISSYDPKQLFPIPRQINRDKIGVDGSAHLPFYGFDVWNHYEVSWLNEKGKPIAAVAEIIYGCNSPNIIESKSMKLYFNSLNNSKFKDIATVEKTVTQDLAAHLGRAFVSVRIIPVQLFREQALHSQLEGESVDELDIEFSHYHANPSLLSTSEEIVTETLCSDLLKSNCLVTNQPDWCSVQITYTGKKINRANLLRYLVSFRNDNEFHEQCIEKIFMHLKQYCESTELTVYGRSTRRGGLDINSIRSTKKFAPEEIKNIRLCRQ